MYSRPRSQEARNLTRRSTPVLSWNPPTKQGWYVHRYLALVESDSAMMCKFAAATFRCQNVLHCYHHPNSNHCVKFIQNCNCKTNFVPRLLHPGHRAAFNRHLPSSYNRSFCHCFAVAEPAFHCPLQRLPNPHIDCSGGCCIAPCSGEPTNAHIAEAGGPAAGQRV